VAVSVDLTLPSADAVNFFRGKGLRASFAWQDMLHEEHDAAFTVAKMMDLDLLRDVRSAVDRAIANGDTFEEFRRSIEPTLVERGWWGRAEMRDPVTGELKNVQLGSVRRLKTIFRTNIKTAYAAGHWAQIVDQARTAPYLMYDAVDDGATREEHAQWDGKVFSVDDEFWQTWFPPNGWNCRCSVVQIDAEQLRDLGKSGPDKAPPTPTRSWTNPRTGDVQRIPVGIDPGWNYHPGRSRTAALRTQLSEKAQHAPADEARATIQLVERKAPPPTLEETLVIGRRVTEELLTPAAGQAATPQVVRERIAARLRRDVGEPVAANTTGRSAAAKLVKDVSRLLPRDWVEATNAHGALYVRSTKRGRGYQYTVSASHDGRTIRLPGMPPITARRGDGFIVARDHQNALHEYAHRVQHVLPEIDDLFQQLHARRSAGKPLVPLRSLAPGRAYRPDELGRNGGYIDPYFGKEYSESLAYRGRNGALEMMSMSIETVLGGEDDAFFKLRDHDREIFDLTVGVLFGMRPSGRR
jgi:SPP1 gp7 family putative phage head morphogenesis protein